MFNTKTAQINANEFTSNYIPAGINDNVHLKSVDVKKSPNGLDFIEITFENDEGQIATMTEWKNEKNMWIKTDEDLQKRDNLQFGRMMQIINSLGSPSRISSVGDGVEIIVYENFNSMTLGTGNATAYGNGSYANAYGNSYSYRVNNRNYVEFYIKNGSCYQVKTNAKGWEKRREKYKMDDDLRNGLLIGGGTCVVTLLLLLLAGNK